MQTYNNFSTQSSMYLDAVAVATAYPIASGRFTLQPFNQVIVANAPVIPVNSILYGSVNLVYFFAGAGLADLGLYVQPTGSQTYQGYAESFGGRLIVPLYLGVLAFNFIAFSGATNCYIAVTGYQINFI